MGNFNSQFPNDSFEDGRHVAKDWKISSRPGTPVPTPKHRILENDPRSPCSEEILRTPIEVYGNRDIERVGRAMEVLTLDPRSPTVGIVRTPIQVLVNEEERPGPRQTLETDLDVPEELIPDSDEDKHTGEPDVATVADEEPADTKVHRDVKPAASCATPRAGERSGLDKENARNKKQLFVTPEGRTPRTPLGPISASANSPRLVLRGKQCMAIDKARPSLGQNKARLLE